MKIYLSFIIFILSISVALSQPDSLQTNVQKIPIDHVVGVVGNNAILLSDIENMYMQAMFEGVKDNGYLKCSIFEDLLLQKLLINQAQIDSIEVSDKEVEAQLNQRINMFLAQAGGDEKELERQFNKPMKQIKTDLFDHLKQQMITQRMQSKISEDIKITPSEVREYFRTIPKDSVPLIETEMEISEIVIRPNISKEERQRVKDKLTELRQQVITSADPAQKFSALARIYTEDYASQKQGGELGYTPRDMLVAEFSNSAFSLKEGEVSEVVESEYGFHIIQLIGRRGNLINVRHILMKPKESYDEVDRAKRLLDSIATVIRKDTLTFEQAAKKFSDAESGRNGGIVINPMTNDSKFTVEVLEQYDRFAFREAKTMKVAEISDPFEALDEKGSKVYKIITLKSYMKEHKADMKTDYQRIMNDALEQKQQREFEEWVVEKQKTTYIHIDPTFKNCNFSFSGWLK